MIKENHFIIFLDIKKKKYLEDELDLYKIEFKFNFINLIDFKK